MLRGDIIINTKLQNDLLGNNFVSTCEVRTHLEKYHQLEQWLTWILMIDPGSWIMSCMLWCFVGNSILDRSTMHEMMHGDACMDATAGDFLGSCRNANNFVHYWWSSSFMRECYAYVCWWLIWLRLMNLPIWQENYAWSNACDACGNATG